MLSKLSTDNYPYQSWVDKFEDNKVSIKSIRIHSSWKKLFEEYDFKSQEEFLSWCLEESKRKIKIYPYPDLLFAAFNLTPFEKVQVVILGQDPYFKQEHEIPQAMGLSFSVPKGVAVPSSLSNIYRNLVNHKHIMKKPDSGNLVSWAYQGCLMLNTSLTVQHGYANSHKNKWTEFTNKVIKYISDNKDNVAFLLWGSPALSKIVLIDETKHFVSVSSHPSGLSCNNKLRQYPSFNNCDHFGKVNEFLLSKGKKPIVWAL